ncbi:hypothetical protein IWQ61_005281 [Dispira simplex]|nr:hypothetical protein IWQ61_005281 [Dispira simplex]
MRTQVPIGLWLLSAGWVYGLPHLKTQLPGGLMISENPLKPPPPNTASFPRPVIGCHNDIYCEGPILETVQLSGVYPDSKTFVDQPTLVPVDKVKANFKKIKNSDDKEGVLRFLKENFGEAGSDLAHVNPQDFHKNPKFLNDIKDRYLKGWAEKLHNFWPELTRKVDKSQLCKGCISSLLDIPYPFVMPGGRFREYYYWDSYFTMEGLLESEMKETVKLMILNFLYIVKEKGFVPNGARVYYLNRSQPPMLTQMVRLYFDSTGDYEFLLEALPVLEQEHRFWENERTVTVDGTDGKKHKLAHYQVDTDRPRPEAYKEDIHVAEAASRKGPDAAKYIYSDLAAGAESGLDYTSRWTESDNLKDPEILETLQTHLIIPVELNSILYQNERDLAILLYKAVQYLKKDHRDQSDKAQKQIKEFTASNLRFYQAYKNRVKAMNAVLWDGTQGMYKDWNIATRQHEKQFTLTDFWPLWSMPETMSDQVILNYHQELSMLVNSYEGGLPTTLKSTNLQWDFPNAWPPLQYMATRGLQQTYDTLFHRHPGKENSTLFKDIRKSEITMAQKYINNAFCAWYETGGEIPGVLARKAGIETSDTGNMFEKFDALNLGHTGTGGEYEPQVGFGWTNGVAIWLMGLYGESLTTPPCLGS